MKLIKVLSAEAVAGTDIVACIIVANLGDGEQQMEFGWSRNDPYGLGPEVTAWFAENPEFPIVAAPLLQPVLPDLLPYQFRAMLLLSGKQPAFDAFVASLPDPQKTIASAKLDYSLSFHRSNDFVLAAQQAIGLTDAELDALWTQAAAIK